MSNAAAEKVDANLKEEHATGSQYEERVSKIEQELKDATHKCEVLKEDNKVKAAELAKALQDAHEARSESRTTREELRQARQIALKTRWS